MQGADRVTSNLVLLHNASLLEANAGLISGDLTAESGYDTNTIICSDRNNYFKASSETSSINFRCKFNTAQAINYLYITRAKMIVADALGDYIHLTLQADSEPTFESDDLITDVFNHEINLIGDDYILETAFTGTYNYTKLTLNTYQETLAFRLGMIYVGAWLDLGDPKFSLSYDKVANGDTSRFQKRNITLSWQDLTFTQKLAFENYIKKYKHIAPVVLYDRNDLIFGGDKCVQCVLSSANITITEMENYNIDATFVEI